MLSFYFQLNEWPKRNTPSLAQNTHIHTQMAAMKMLPNGKSHRVICVQMKRKSGQKSHKCAVMFLTFDLNCDFLCILLAFIFFFIHFLFFLVLSQPFIQFTFNPFFSICVQSNHFALDQNARKKNYRKLFRADWTSVFSLAFSLNKKKEVPKDTRF